MPICEPSQLLQMDVLMQESGRFENGRRALSPMTLHERLVGHTLSVTDDLEGRSGVWGEHSYARERGAAPHSHVRTLLLPRAPIASQPAPLALVDALSSPPARPAPPLDVLAASESEDDEATDADDWERSVLDGANSEAQRRLAGVVVELLAEMRLRRLAVDRSRWRRAEAARGAAARLRIALATATAGDSAWMHGALLTHLPRSQRTPYERVTGELRRVAPRLAARLAAPTPPPPAEPLDSVPPPLDAASGPWLGWVSAGLDRRDERWRRRLGALMHVRLLGGGGAGVGAPPERWCATRAHAVRSALVRLLQEAGSRPVVLGGCGAGAALAARLASARGVRGAVLLAPPLLTAEGPDEPLGEVPAAALVVAGGAAATTWRGAAAEMAAGGGSRRLLLVAGADDALRLPRRHRLRLGVPQQALDAAIAEECARWVGEVCAEETDGPIEEGAAASAAADASPGQDRGTGSVEVIEGRVVSRVSGGTPLALRPPGGRRADLHAADIMRLPIVFADDLTSAAEPKDERVRVVAGATRAPRVIVTKRSALEGASPVRRPRVADAPRRRP